MDLSHMLMQCRAVDPHFSTAIHGTWESFFTGVSFLMPLEHILVMKLFATILALELRRLMSYHVSPQSCQGSIPYAALFAFVPLVT